VAAESQVLWSTVETAGVSTVSYVKCVSNDYSNPNIIYRFIGKHR